MSRPNDSSQGKRLPSVADQTANIIRSPYLAPVSRAEERAAIEQAVAEDVVRRMTEVMARPFLDTNILLRHIVQVDAFELYVNANLSFADCWHIAVAESIGDGRIFSFDRGLDRLPTIQRIEPQ